MHLSLLGRQPNYRLQKPFPLVEAVGIFSLVFVQDFSELVTFYRIVDFFSLVPVVLVNLPLLLGCQPNYRIQKPITLVGAVGFFSLVFVQD